MLNDHHEEHHLQVIFVESNIIINNITSALVFFAAS